ncbi:MAG: VanZ family protein [Clostridiales bacterium]|nr:VanZ family protein [Clostridiales bacterium]
MGLVFFFSSQSGGESAETSMRIVRILTEFLEKHFSQLFVRKLAHFSEFCALSFLMYNAFFRTRIKKRLSPFLPVVLSAAYAASDEIHQYFVPGRVCSIADVGIDTAGVLLGAVVFYLVARLCIRLVTNKKRSDGDKADSRDGNEPQDKHGIDVP